MMKTQRANLNTLVHTTAWVDIENPDLSVEDAVEILRERDNDIVEVDEEGRRIKIADSVEHPMETIYECEKCGAYSRSEKRTQEHEEKCMTTNKNSTTNETTEEAG